MGNENIWLWIIGGIGCLAGFIYWMLWNKYRGTDSDVKATLVPDKKLEHVIKKIADNFNGIWSVANKQQVNASNVFANLDKIVEYLEDDSFRMWWRQFTRERMNWSDEEYRKKAALLLDLFICNGLECGGLGHIIVSVETSLAYVCIDGEISMGAEARVLAPYWKFQGTFIEKGFITKI